MTNGQEGRATTTEADQAGPPADVVAGVERFMGDVRGWLAFYLLMLGHRTGLLDAVRAGAGTTSELSRRAGTHERSTAEWLAGMTAAGYLQHDMGVFTMPPGQAALFEGGVLPFDPTVLFTFPDVITRVQPEVEQSMRDGGGVPYARYQPEFSSAQEAMNGPLYDMFLVKEWIPSVSGLQERLTAGADVVEIGCGGPVRERVEHDCRSICLEFDGRHPRRPVELLYAKRAGAGEADAGQRARVPGPADAYGSAVLPPSVTLAVSSTAPAPPRCCPRDRADPACREG